MLVCKKKFTEIVAAWFEKVDREDKGSWLYNDDIITVLPGNSIFRVWDNYRRNGGLPEAGAYNDQPLDVMVKIGVIQTAFDTFSYKNQKEADWNEFTPTQLELIRQVDG